MKDLHSKDPSNNYAVLGKVAESSVGEIKGKVSFSKEAQFSWGLLSIEERVACLKKVFEAFSSRRKKLAKLISQEVGMPISDSMVSDIDLGLEYFRWYLENTGKFLQPEVAYEDGSTVHKVFYEPIGVAAVIIPWNFPFSNFVWGVIPNLLVGNTVILKHSEKCLLVGKFIEDIFDEAMFPANVFSEVYGDRVVGEELLNQNIDLLWFTGSTETGKQVYAKGQENLKKVLLELGGSAPGIVFSDSNLDEVIDAIIALRFFNAGQVCDGMKRLIVEESVVENLIEGLSKRIEGIKIGPALNIYTELGPLVCEKQKTKLEEQIKKSIQMGAKVVSKGVIPEGLEGAYVEPLLVADVTSEVPIWKEEVFGPVLPVVSFSSEEEAVALANETDYGLGGYVFSSDLEKAYRVSRALKTGTISINNVSYLLPCNPFGGFKKSGLGREHGKWGLRELCEIKVISSPKEE